jgi:hypothetical protein
MLVRVKRIDCLGNRFSTDNVISHRVLRIATCEVDAKMIGQVSALALLLARLRSEDGNLDAVFF